MQRGTHGEFFEVGRTETLENTNHPDWVDKIVVNYYFEERCVSEKIYLLPQLMSLAIFFFFF